MSEPSLRSPQELEDDYRRIRTAFLQAAVAALVPAGLAVYFGYTPAAVAAVLVAYWLGCVLALRWVRRQVDRSIRDVQLERAGLSEDEEEG
jgi:hypothetical protein